MHVVEPPRRPASILRRLGPGLIVAGSIVGSGELIATTKVGAEAGFALLWLIVVGCVIKVFTQVELGRAAVTRGKTALGALDSLPGPRARAGWAVWLWLVMTLLTLAQQGGIVGGVGQALAIAQPLTEEGAAYNEAQDAAVRAQVERALRGEGNAAVEALELEEPKDAYLWAAIVALPTALVLVVGRYGLIQFLATALVAAFTAVTIATLAMLQLEPDWAIRGGEIVDGLSFRLPDSGVGTALAAFGIIGVGAAELVMYPYWCLEKGYARWTGPREAGDAWRERARGWMRVLRWDAWLSACVYTFATVAFFLLGAAVLGRVGLNPSGGSMIRTLAEMYAPVFGEWASEVFLFGAFAVLYSTFFVASAGLARVAADAVRVFGVRAGSDEAWTRFFCAVFPLTSLTVFCFVQAPVKLVLASGVAQALMLPVLGFTALWFRYRRTEPALRPGKLWDAVLWLSCAGFLVAGGWALLGP